MACSIYFCLHLHVPRTNMHLSKTREHMPQKSQQRVRLQHAMQNKETAESSTKPLRNPTWGRKYGQGTVSTLGIHCTITKAYQPGNLPYGRHLQAPSQSQQQIKVLNATEADFTAQRCSLTFPNAAGSSKRALHFRFLNHRRKFRPSYGAIELAPYPLLHAGNR